MRLNYQSKPGICWENMKSNIFHFYKKSFQYIEKLEKFYSEHVCTHHPDITSNILVKVLPMYFYIYQSLYLPIPLNFLGISKQIVNSPHPTMHTAACTLLSRINILVFFWWKMLCNTQIKHTSTEFLTNPQICVIWTHQNIEYYHYPRNSPYFPSYSSSPFTFQEATTVLFFSILELNRNEIYVLLHMFHF